MTTTTSVRRPDPARFGDARGATAAVDGSVGSSPSLIGLIVGSVWAVGWSSVLGVREVDGPGSAPHPVDDGPRGRKVRDRRWSASTWRPRPAGRGAADRAERPGRAGLAAHRAHLAARARAGRGGPARLGAPVHLGRRRRLRAGHCADPPAPDRPRRRSGVPGPGDDRARRRGAAARGAAARLEAIEVYAPTDVRLSLRGDAVVYWGSAGQTGQGRGPRRPARQASRSAHVRRERAGRPHGPAIVPWSVPRLTSHGHSWPTSVHLLTSPGVRDVSTCTQVGRRVGSGSRLQSWAQTCPRRGTSPTVSLTLRMT